MVKIRKCDCDERIGVEINSFKLLEELKIFFDEQIDLRKFSEIPVSEPYFSGYNLKPDEIKEEYKWYADKWYKCSCCGTLWEIRYPDFPAKGFVRKFPDGKHTLKEI